MTSTQIEFTPTQQRLLKVLSDGERHEKDELWECLGDDKATGNNLRVHLTYLRKKLRAIGEDITTEFIYRKFTYRHVRLLSRARNS